MSEPICKNCKQANSPYYHERYHGYCLECFNARAEEKDAEIRVLRAALKRAYIELGCDYVKEPENVATWEAGFLVSQEGFSEQDADIIRRIFDE